MPTIPELVNRAVAVYADRVAVIDEDRQLTFAEIGGRISRLANALLGLSSHEGSRVAILMRNRLEYVESDFAIALAGKVKVPMNPRLSDDERTFVLDDSGADILITEQGELDRMRDICLARQISVVCVDDVSASSGLHDYHSLLSASSAKRPTLRLDPERLSQLLYTSGTTGRPKGAMLLDRCRVSATTMSLTDEYLVTPTDGMVHSGPLSHGSASKLLTFFVRGARNIVLPKFEPELFVRAVHQSGGTSSFVVPTMIQMLVDHLSEHPAEPWGLRNLTYGGASISRPTLDAALDCLGPVLTQVYGSCEAPHPVLTLRHRDEADPSVPDPLGVPAGYPSIGVDIRITDAARNDVELDAAGARTGELLVRGPNVMAGYWDKPDATSEAIVDGWYLTGDIVTVDANGRYVIVDRSKDIVISGGLNIYPAEVERVLRELPGVAEVSVVGVSDEKWGEAVTAAVVVSPGATIEVSAVEEWCTDRLAGYKKPRHVVMLDDLPKGSTGKILKREVRALVEKRLTATH
jgi:acyl-CoA synthetase (AMP-forming)/AMP-acid ligase II